MGQIRVDQGRRRPGRQWLGIELSAFVLLGAGLMTIAWTHDHISTAAVAIGWVAAGCVTVFALRDLYRSMHRAAN